MKRAVRLNVDCCIEITDDRQYYAICNECLRCDRYVFHTLLTHGTKQVFRWVCARCAKAIDLEYKLPREKTLKLFIVKKKGQRRTI